MSENPFIHKRQKARNKPLLTLRNIISLIVLSLVVYIGFRFWVGNTDGDACGGVPCENLYSFGVSAMGFAMMFLAVIAAGGVAGLVFAMLKRRNKDNFSAYLQDEPTDNDT